MAKAFGIVSFAGNHVRVDGLRAYRPAGAFSFLGRYRIIDFPISNMSNSGIDQIQVYIRRQPRSLAEHLGSDVTTIQPQNAENSSCFSQRTVWDKISTIQISQLMHKTWKASKLLTSLMSLLAPSYMITHRITMHFSMHILNPVQISHFYITQ